MVPADSVLTDVLPTERLHPNGKPKPELRVRMRRIPDVRNAGNVGSVWAQSFGLIWVAVRIDNPFLWVATFFLMGRAFGLFAILSHEAAHKLLFTNKRVNDAVGRWGLAYPAFVPLDLYRRSHFAHHREEFGPEEPDLAFYSGYPLPASSLRRKLRRDATGESGWKNLKGLLVALTSKAGRPIAGRILFAQACVWVILLAIGGWGHWWLYPVMWLAPWMTVWRVLNRLRSIAEHGGLEASDDRRQTTHVVKQSWAARFWIVPFNTGWHLAHHVDMGVPFQRLPELHHELVAAGWITPELEYPSYVALWRTLASGEEPAAS